jgi:hypothetical protein
MLVWGRRPRRLAAQTEAHKGRQHRTAVAEQGRVPSASISHRIYTDFKPFTQVLQNIHHVKNLAPPPRPNMPLPSLPPGHTATIGNLGSRCPTPALHPANALQSGKSSRQPLPRPGTGEMQLLLVADAMKKRQHAWRTAFRSEFQFQPYPALNPNRILCAATSNAVPTEIPQGSGRELHRDAAR